MTHGAWSGHVREAPTFSLFLVGSTAARAVASTGTASAVSLPLAACFAFFTFSPEAADASESNTRFSMLVMGRELRNCGARCNGAGSDSVERCDSVDYSTLAHAE